MIFLMFINIDLQMLKKQARSLMEFITMMLIF